jgi:hypothetical protein
MPAKYYRDKLYPFQDQVLKLIQDLDVGFYLTGGTALGRCFLNHRYSDDLKNYGVVSNSTAQGDQMDKTGQTGRIRIRNRTTAQRPVLRQFQFTIWYQGFWTP